MNVQMIRLVDVLLIAPLLMYAATKKELNTNERTAIALIGMATLFYNGLNYLQNE